MGKALKAAHFQKFQVLRLCKSTLVLTKNQSTTSKVRVDSSIIKSNGSVLFFEVIFYI